MESNPFCQTNKTTLICRQDWLLCLMTMLQMHTFHFEISNVFLVLFFFFLVVSLSSDAESKNEVKPHVNSHLQELAAIQTDLIRCNRIFFSHIRNYNRLNKQINSVFLFRFLYSSLSEASLS